MISTVDTRPVATPRLSSDVLRLDCAAEVERVGARLREILGTELHRRGVVVAVSGGVDSAVCASLAARALGPSKVLALILPERDSSPDSRRLARALIDGLGVPWREEDIAPALEAIGCYRWRDEAIRAVFPDYDGTWRNKIVIARAPQGGFSYFKLVVQKPDGSLAEERLPHEQYLQLVAATSYKQRLRKTIEYFHADRLHYAVIGTPNRLEYDQGFFVKNGDGSADLKPIAHLYKTQVYALAEHLGVPEEIRRSRPSTDTYSLSQGQDEFYFGLPYEKMDIALWAHNHGVSAAALAEYFGIDESEAKAIYAGIEAKRRTTRYLHARPRLIEPVGEIGS
jgi:NAD+ synthase